MFWETATPLEIVCGAACDAELQAESVRRISLEWGECGRVATEDDEVLGFIKYAPPKYFPQTRFFPSGPPSEKSVLLACIHIRDDARRHGLGRLLLQAALRDLALRGERTVEAFAISNGADMAMSPVMGVEFLLRHGFTVARPHPTYPLLKLDLRTLASWTENLEAVLETLRIPLHAPRRMPSPSIK
jgi:GNAT superfamily N-acetyltransferase